MNTNTGKIRIILLSICLLFSAFRIAFAAETWTLEPGKKIGWIVFGSTSIKDVVKQFGDLDGRSKDDVEILYRNKYGLDFVYDKRTLRVLSVMVTKAESGGVKYRTDSSLFVGAPMASAYKVYGKPHVVTTKKPYEIATYFDRDRFLTFVGINGTIAAIWTGMKSVYDSRFNQFKEALQ